MAQFTVNADRHDPYKNMKFLVLMEGRAVAGVSKVSALKRSTEVVTHREGGDPSTSRVSPSLWKFEPITLERGVTYDPDFEAWANLVYATDNTFISLKRFRKNLTIQLRDEAGRTVLAYNVFRCWVSEYQALPELDANGHAIAIEHIVLQNEGWERDAAVVETAEP